MVNKYKERLKHYTINRKLKATLGVVALIACIIGVILISGILAVANNVKGIYQGPMNNVNDIANVKYGLTDLQRAINRLLAEGSDNMADRYANFEKTVEEVSILSFQELMIWISISRQKLREQSFQKCRLRLTRARK